MNKHSLYHIATIVLPFLSLLIAAGVAYVEINRLHLLESDYSHTEQQIGILEQTVAAQRGTPPGAKRATAQISPHEQTDFLTWLRQYAAFTHVQISRWTNTPPSAGSALPASVAESNSTVEVTGAYGNIRQFLYNVERDSPRLLNLSNVNWNRGTPPVTRLTFTLTRYVAPETTISTPPVETGSH